LLRKGLGHPAKDVDGSGPLPEARRVARPEGIAQAHRSDDLRRNPAVPALSRDVPRQIPTGEECDGVRKAARGQPAGEQPLWVDGRTKLVVSHLMPGDRAGPAVPPSYRSSAQDVVLGA